MSDTDRAEIEDAVGKELGALGVAGRVMVVGGSMELRPASGESPVSIDVATILGQWPLLPEEMRKRKVGEVAMRLVGALEASRGVQGRAAPSRDVDEAQKRVIRAVVGVFALLALIGVARMAIPRLFGGEKPPPPPPDETEVGRSDRLDRACDAARDAVYKGTSFGSLPLEGWAVELWLARKDGQALARHPAVAGLAPGGKIAASVDPELAKIRDGHVEISDGFPAGAREPGWAAATVVFHEGYARAFFSEQNHTRFLTLADRLAGDTGADLAAVYARCAHLPTHDIGAWFHASDGAGVGAVLVYQMGMFAEGKVVDRSALGPMAPADLDALRKAADGIAGGEDGLARLLTAHGGNLSSMHGTTLVFPLTVPLRPLDAAKDLARRMGVELPSVQ